ncbi:uncharacterized protein EV420DRAFT_1516849 [Desarmillaria tabescens]|uniref:F-box domain-containing protein n=1 Tax=Armillaria tabescens TaxID=1929756 RepID=A0AA39TVE1_ARMTA|nr:uncharacterized protein EV420DRAFT_1516849 [Desarmillaria tabescens]KAK0464534.1 hypothetical protein EV420DRAFT_1516849 [Desarmillaria tabescens]
MSPPVELISHVLAELWAYPLCTEERINAFTTCSLVSKQWSAVIKEVNSVHSWIPLSYNKGQLYTVKSAHISNPMLCRTITSCHKCYFWIKHANPSIAANRGVEFMFRRIFSDPNSPRHAIHLYLDYVDDHGVHIPSFWIPPQITQMTIVYHYPRWIVSYFLEQNHTVLCRCKKLAVDRRVSHLTVMGPARIVKPLIASRDEWQHLVLLTTNVDNIPASSRTSVIRKSYDFPLQYVGDDYALQVMFGDQSLWLHRPYHGQLPRLSVIPVGSVGYIDPLTRKFVILFNGIDPAASTDQRIKSIPSLLEGGVTKLVCDPNLSAFPDWDQEYTLSNLLRAWIDGRSVYSVPVTFNVTRSLGLAVGRVFARELHKQIIMGVFGEDHPYIQQHLDLVTTAIDSSQYAWFARLYYGPGGVYGRNEHFYFRVNPRASLNPGSPWGNFTKRDC